jgi:MoxR-like ATPase
MADDRLDGARPDADGRRTSGPPRAESADRPQPDWWIYRGTGRPLHDIDLHDLLPPPPRWRSFDGGPAQPMPKEDQAELDRRLGPVENSWLSRPDAREAEAVNAALYLRRPLMLTGNPGVGKSSLVYRISRELRLGRVLRWPISSRSTLRNGLYEYDAIGRAQDSATRQGPRLPGGSRAGTLPRSNAPASTGLGEYMTLGALGTALLPYELPRVLLIDELDKSDIDLPNDLLDVFEEGQYIIPELVRVRAREPKVTVHTADPGGTAAIQEGQVRCRAFPMIVITSNGEREFPPAFLRRCIRLEMGDPDEERLAGMVAAHFADSADGHSAELIRNFLEHRRVQGSIAADQLLNSIFLATSGCYTADDSWDRLLDLIWQRLTIAGTQ